MSVWLERDSLNKLLEHSKYPLIRTHIKRLYIFGDRVSPYVWNGKPYVSGGLEVDHYYVPKDLQQLLDWADGNLEGQPLTLIPSSRKVDRPSTIINTKDIIDRLDFQKRMELESLDIELLSEAFRELPNLTSLLFEYTDFPPGSWKLAQSGFKIFGTGIPWRCHVFQVVMQAASKAKCKPREIAWHNQVIVEGLEGLPIWALNDITPLLISQDQMVHLLSNISVLSLQSISGNESHSEAHPFDDHVSNQALGHFIELCPQLEELYLGFPSHEEYSGLTREDLMGKALGAKLRILTFKSMSIDSSQLALCITTNKSLERVTLIFMYLTDGDWMSFLDQVKASSPPLLKNFNVIQRDTKGQYYNDLIDDCIRNGYDEDEDDDLLEYIKGDTYQEHSSPESTLSEED